MHIFRTKEGYKKGSFLYKGHKITIINTLTQAEFVVTKGDSSIGSGAEKGVKLALEAGKKIADKHKKGTK